MPATATKLQSPTAPQVRWGSSRWHPIRPHQLQMLLPPSVPATTATTVPRTSRNPPTAAPTPLRTSRNPPPPLPTTALPTAALMPGPTAAWPSTAPSRSCSSWCLSSASSWTRHLRPPPARSHRCSPRNCRSRCRSRTSWPTAPRCTASLGLRSSSRSTCSALRSPSARTRSSPSLLAASAPLCRSRSTTTTRCRQRSSRSMA
mmetsp:Transcript_174195/g.553011  ORF Transcript_174195/g.553011 Transcript_174195/m.553011 type:complete len:203 (+) Transcript_174195:167-775(+)